MDKLTLASKLASVRAKIGSLAPDKTNKDQNYKYISADKILERAGDALAEAGIIILPAINSCDVTFFERPNKSPRIDAIIRMEMVVTDGETALNSLWIGSGSDYTAPEKAVSKAVTNGHKYYLMKLLNIGIGNEDGEHDSHAEPEQPSETKQPAQEAPAMTIEQAHAFKASTGETYGERSTETLAHIANNKKAPAESREAARIIIEHRAKAQ